MRYLLGAFLMIGGLCGAIMSLFGLIAIDSSLSMLSGYGLSLGLTLFCLLVFVNSLSNLFLDN